MIRLDLILNEHGLEKEQLLLELGPQQQEWSRQEWRQQEWRQQEWRQQEWRQQGTAEHLVWEEIWNELRWAAGKRAVIVVSRQQQLLEGDVAMKQLLEGGVAMKQLLEGGMAMKQLLEGGVAMKQLLE